ncbi:transketolase family protein [Halobacteriovorax sp. HLS]|uniref:transketolase family protein n=1 Tax=Halobacteriovorax sp. HLS TaxID=2234000 RepID=UPI000FDA4E16|nr:transketolase C-terminal domain-containing protein [Halobacteriovorax sp. HLS]
MNKRAMRDVFLEELYQRMLIDKNIFFVCADFGSPVLDKIQADIPGRFINVGIAEQNLINVSVGMALEGYTVYAYAIAPFITMRCYEQIRVGVSVLSQVRPMNINIIGVGAGVSYTVSGPTHHCLEDLSIMNTLPNIDIFSPSDCSLVKSYFDYTVSFKHPKYIRFDAQPISDIEAEGFSSDGYRVVNEGDGESVLVSTGYMTHTALEIIKKKNVTLVDIYLVNSFDKNSLFQKLSSFNKILVLEEGIANKGGLVSEIHELFQDSEKNPKVKGIGFSKEYHFDVGSRAEVHSCAKIGFDNIIEILSN